MSQGAMGGLTRSKSRQSRKDTNYYTRQFLVTAANKKRRAAARLRRANSPGALRRKLSREGKHHA